MADSIKTQQYQQGQLVSPTDLSSDIEAARDLVTKAFSDVLGATNVLPAINPLAITLSSSAMTFTIGGAGQSIFALDVTSGNPRIIDSPPLQTFTITPNSTGSARTDYLWVSYYQIPTNPHTVGFSDGSNKTVYQSLEGCQYAYNSSSTPPSGYQLFATLTVPTGATVGTAATVTYQMPTAAARIQALANFPANSVTTLNGKVGSVSIAGSGSVTITPSGNSLIISAAAGTSLNGLVGSVSISAADSSITVTTSGQSVLLRANNPISVSTLNGLNGAVGLSSPNGSIAITQSGNTIYLTNNSTATTLNNLGGAINLNSPDSSLTIATSGQNVNVSLNGTRVSSFFGLSGVVGLSSANGTINVTNTGNTVLLDVGSSYPGMTISRGGILSGTTTITTLPTLPAGTWDIYGHVWMNASVQATINGTGLAGGWALNNPGTSGTAVPFLKEIYGVGAGGDTPSVNVSATGTMAGLCRVWAVRR